MKNKRVIISWTMLISWMGLIFFMSNQPAEISNSQSDVVIKIFAAIGLDLNSYLGSIATFVVRKSAHFTEYFILYFLANGVLKNYFISRNARLYSLIVVLSYAISDEIHQYFIPGRAMALRDVLIDFSGGLIGFLIQAIYGKLRKIRNNNLDINTNCL